MDADVDVGTATHAAARTAGVDAHGAGESASRNERAELAEDGRRVQAPSRLAALDRQADGTALAETDGDDEATVSHVVAVRRLSRA